MDITVLWWYFNCSTDQSLLKQFPTIARTSVNHLNISSPDSHSNTLRNNKWLIHLRKFNFTTDNIEELSECSRTEKDTSTNDKFSYDASLKDSEDNENRIIFLALDVLTERVGFGNEIGRVHIITHEVECHPEIIQEQYSTILSIHWSY